LFFVSFIAIFSGKKKMNEKGERIKMRKSILLIVVILLVAGVYGKKEVTPLPKTAW
jgi:uncharacterized membrane protein SpoIIM required for sporulation